MKSSRGLSGQLLTLLDSGANTGLGALSMQKPHALSK